MVGLWEWRPRVANFNDKYRFQNSDKPHVIIVVKVKVTTDLAAKLWITDSNISASSFCAQCTNGFFFQNFDVAEVAINNKPIWPNIWIQMVETRNYYWICLEFYLYTGKRWIGNDFFLFLFFYVSAKQYRRLVVVGNLN
jgi:hypothetical protein